MRFGGKVALAALALAAPVPAAAEGSTVLRVSPISVPGAANGRHFSIAVTADFAVADQAAAKLLCRWMPRVRDTVLRTVDFDSLNPREPGAELPAATGVKLRKAINRTVGTDLVRAVHMHQSHRARRGKAEHGFPSKPTTCRQLGVD